MIHRGRIHRDRCRQPPIITGTTVELNNNSNTNKHTIITPPTHLHSNKKQQEHSSVNKPQTQQEQKLRKEQQNKETRQQLMEKLDRLQAESFGGDMETNKRAGTRRFSTFNPNGLKSQNANDTIEISIEMGIDVQCYSEIAMYTSQYRVHQKLIDNLRQIDKKANAV